MRKGFTLVELSIVLVIIGLLIGGILVGQSLIESAKINKEVNRLSQYAIAVVQFKQKFKQEAGDTTLFPNPGNNDGDTTDTVGSCPTRTSETVSVWSHLTQSGMLTGESYVWPNPGVSCAGWVNNNGSGYVGVAPTNKMTANGSIQPYSYGYNASAFYNIGGNKYQRALNAGYDPEILWGLDNKLDDGVPSLSTGRMLSRFPTFTPCTPQFIATVAKNARICFGHIYFNDSFN